MIDHYSDHSANERTFLAWVRTAIAIVGFGVAAARLANPDAGPQPWSELALLVTGGIVIVIVIAYLRMRWLRKQIASPERADDGATGANALLVLMVTALFAMLAAFAFHISASTSG